MVADRQASHLLAGPSNAAAAAAGPSSKLQAFLSGRKGTGRGKAAAAPSKAQLAEQQRQHEQQRLVERKLKKQFLSAKVWFQQLSLLVAVVSLAVCSYTATAQQAATAAAGYMSRGVTLSNLQSPAVTLETMP